MKFTANQVIVGIIIIVLVTSTGTFFLTIELVKESLEDNFCMENDFALRVMSCFVGNQSQCLNITIGDNSYGKVGVPLPNPTEPLQIEGEIE